MPAAGGGAIIGGWIIKRYSLNCTQIMKVMTCSTMVVTVLFSGILISCDSIKFIGVTQLQNSEYVVALNSSNSLESHNYRIASM